VSPKPRKEVETFLSTALGSLNAAPDVPNVWISPVPLPGDKIHRIIGCIAHADQYTTRHRYTAVHAGPAMSKDAPTFFNNG
jgi:hypothetical protein